MQWLEHGNYLNCATQLWLFYLCVVLYVLIVYASAFVLRILLVAFKNSLFSILLATSILD